MCRTWNRFVTMEETRINKQIFLNDYYSSVETWCSDFYSICYVLKCEESYENLREIDLDTFQARLYEYAQEKWFETVNSKPKLRTYRIFKTKLVPEDYVLRLMSRYHRSTFAKFRCGILPLNLEVGRYRGIKAEDRICPLCKDGVKTETHFLFECNVYDGGNFMQNTNVDSNLLSNDDKLKILMDNHQKET